MSDVSPEVMARKREQAAESKAKMQAALGARACNASECPLVQLRGSCPKIGTGDCPPEAIKLTQEDIPAVLDDDSVGEVYATGGGFYALHNAAAGLQSAVINTRKQVEKKPLSVHSRDRPNAKTTERSRRGNVVPRSGDATVGHLAASIVSAVLGTGDSKTKK